jgi:hypothetical protein
MLSYFYYPIQTTLSKQFLQYFSYQFIGLCLNVSPTNVYLFYLIYKYFPLFYTMNNLRKKL